MQTNLFVCTQQHRIEQTLTSPDAVAEGSLETARDIANRCFENEEPSEGELARAVAFIQRQGKDKVSNAHIAKTVAVLCNKAAQVPVHAHHIHV